MVSAAEEDVEDIAEDYEVDIAVNIAGGVSIAADAGIAVEGLPDTLDLVVQCWSSISCVTFLEISVVEKNHGIYDIQQEETTALENCGTYTELEVLVNTLGSHGMHIGVDKALVGPEMD